MEIINPNTLPSIEPFGCSSDAVQPPHQDQGGGDGCTYDFPFCPKLKPPIP